VNDGDESRRERRVAKRGDQCKKYIRHYSICVKGHI
jgi:hypothetical protein